MTRPLVWYDEQDAGVERFGADLYIELVRSEVERLRDPPPASCAETEEE